MKQRYEDGDSWLEYRGYQVVYAGSMPARWVANIGNSASTIWEKSSLVLKIGSQKFCH